jgi:DNA-binding NarL/FixJ family response regulator
MTVRILIADDDATIRMLFRRLLEVQAEWRVCAEAVNGVDAIEQVAQIMPDLAILDLGMPMKNGIEAAREISREHPGLPMLLTSVQEMSDELVAAARQAGFRGAITKNRGHEIVRGVEAVLQNQPFFRPVTSSSGRPVPL